MCTSSSSHCHLTPQEGYLVKLEKVIGMSSKNINSIAINPINGDVSYPAGCVIVIYSPKENKQTKFLYSNSQRSFSCLSYSNNGKYLVAGEGALRLPEITIWEILSDGNYKEIKNLKGHKYGIEAVRFAPNHEYLISLGDNNDRGLFVWDWQNEQRVTSNKLGKPVNTFSFQQNGEYFVTAGFQHLKFWYFDENCKVQKTETNNKESIMESKSADLSKVKVKNFVGVVCNSDQVFALAIDGHLYVYDKTRKLLKWMDIKVEKALSCTLTNQHLFCGCSDGVIRVFNSQTLEHKVTLPKPPPLGSANIEAGVKKIRIPATKESKFADLLCVIVDEQHSRVVALYSDRMIFMWDIKNFEKISVYRTFLSHCGPIHDIQYIPNNMKIGHQDNEEAKQLDNEEGFTKFVTCSSDRTIRFWHFIDPTQQKTKIDKINKGLVRNAYCKDMSRMIYVKQELQINQGQFDHFKFQVQISDQIHPEQAQEDKIDLENVLRCIKYSPDGRHIACGDWTGNIRIHDLNTFEEIQCIQAHDEDVVCLDYSPWIQPAESPKEPVHPKFWLASASRDRLTQLFEVVDDQYENVTILEDHSSTITSVKFFVEYGQKQQKRLKLVSSGADKQIVTRNIDLDILGSYNAKNICQMTTEEYTTINKKEQCKNKIFTMELSQFNQQSYMVTGHDRLISLWQSNLSEKIWEKKPESLRKTGSNDQLKIYIDHMASIVISSSSDKFISIYEAATGQLICRFTCGEITTGMCLSTNYKHLITTSSEGVIYIWNLPDQLSKALQKISQDFIQNLQPSEETQEQDQIISQNEGNQELQLLEDTKFEEIKKVSKKEEIEDIMQQINKATDQIDKIQPRSKLQKKEDDQSETIGLTRKEIQQKVRELNIKETNLPRWAQSVVGDLKIDPNQQQNQEENENEDVEDIFQQSLSKQEKLLQEEKLKQFLKEKETQQKVSQILSEEEEKSKGVEASKFYKDQFEDEEIEKDDEEINNDDDEEEKRIKEQLKKRKYKMFGAYGEEGTQYNDEVIKMRKRNNTNRTSLSQQFLKNKIMQSKDMLINKKNNVEDKSQDMKIEDLYDENSAHVPQIKGKQQFQPKVDKEKTRKQEEIDEEQRKKQQEEDERIKKLMEEEEKIKKQEEDKRLQRQQQEKEEALRKQQEEQIKKQQEVQQKQKEEEEKFKQLKEQELKNKKQEEEQKQKQLQEQQEIEKKKSKQIEEQEIVQEEQQQQQTKQKLIKNRQKLIEVFDSDQENQVDDQDIEESKQDKLEVPSSEEKNFQLTPQRHQKDLSSSITSSRYHQNDDYLEESAMVEMQSAQQNTDNIDEAALNATLKKEIDNINNSLAKITSALNVRFAFYINQIDAWSEQKEKHLSQRRCHRDNEQINESVELNDVHFEQQDQL